MYFVSINVGAQVAIILLTCGPCVVIVYCWERFCTLGRAPRTKETLPDFHESCRVIRHPRVFRGLTGCQRDTPVLERHIIKPKYEENNGIKYKIMKLKPNCRCYG